MGAVLNAESKVKSDNDPVFREWTIREEDAQENQSLHPLEGQEAQESCVQGRGHWIVTQEESGN